MVFGDPFECTGPTATATASNYHTSTAAELGRSENNPFSSNLHSPMGTGGFELTPRVQLEVSPFSSPRPRLMTRLRNCNYMYSCSYMYS